MSANLSIVIPARNEAKNLPLILEKIGVTMSKASLTYEIIVVIDPSTDNSEEVLRQLKDRYPIKYFQKKGIPGKAYSIIEGSQIAKYPFIAMIDADMQYPPSEIPQMLKKLSTNQKVGLVIGERNTSKAGRIRNILSKTNKRLMSSLTGIDADIQSGLKLFRKEIIKHIQVSEVKPWTLDLKLVQTTLDLGFDISSVKIFFAKRNAGESHINIFSSSIEILTETFKHKLAEKKIFRLLPKSPKSSIGAGVIFNKTKYITHSLLSPTHSAIRVTSHQQKYFLFLLSGILITAMLFAPYTTLTMILGSIIMIHFLDLWLNLYVVTRSLSEKAEYKFSQDQIDALDESALPTYAILCPLYKEGHILPYFVESISALDWPKDKLDVLILLEEDDTDSLTKAKELGLPNYFRIVKVPHSYPKTKPKACNYGLNLVKSDYVVIYDAEDIPDIYQLKKAYLAFQNASDNTACLQAKLNYHNPNQNLLTRLFTAEYSLWFEAILPGLQSLKTALPLGGTSNHFKTEILKKLHGWDSFNVTEDCDLGVRLFKFGYKTAMIDSTTLEEANSNVKNWFRQRSRWVKGYMQTYLLHMRSPIKFFREHKIHMLIFQLIVGGKIFSLFINPFLWMMTISYFLFRPIIGDAIERLYPTYLFYLGSISLVMGNFLYIYYYMIGAAKRGNWGIVKWAFVVPIYWLMISLASIISLYQLIFKPHYWEKTNHGLHLLPKKKSSLIKFSFSLPQFIGDVDWNISKKFSSKQSLFLGLLMVGVTWGGFMMLVQTRHLVNAIQYISLTVSIFSGVILLLYWHSVKPKHIGVDLKGKKNLKILIFNWRDIRHAYAGGAEVYVHELAKRWVENGNEVTIFAGNDGKLPHREIIDGVQIFRGGKPIFNSLWDVIYTATFSKKKKRVKIDGFVYISAIYHYFRYFRNKFDVVIDSQNGIPFFTPLYVSEPIFCLIHHVHQEVFRKSLPLPLALFASILEKLAMGIFYRNTPFIAVSQSTKDQVQQMGWGSAGISVVTPGVDIKKYIPNKKSVHPLIVFVGRLTYYKSVNIFIKMVVKISNEFPDAKFVIAGDGDMRLSLIAYAKKLGVIDKILFTGFIDEAKKIALYQKAWVFMNPSFIEGWGITNIEANACGTLVVASDVAGIKSSVADGVSGYLVKYDDLDAFVVKIREIISNQKLRENFNNQARDWAMNFDWSVSIEEATNVLKGYSVNTEVKNINAKYLINK